MDKGFDKRRIEKTTQSVPNRGRVSASQINSFEACPKQYVLRYLERKTSHRRHSIRLAIGNAIHHALDRFFGLPKKDRSLQVLHECLRSVWHLHRNDAIFASLDEEVAAGEECLNLLTGFYRSFATHETPVSREAWVESRALGTEVSVFGRVDRVDSPNHATGLHVIDYKTGRHEVESIDMHRDRAAQVYLLAVSEDFSEPVEAVKYLYLPSGNEALWMPEAEDLTFVRDSLELVTAEMLHARSMDATPGDHCRFCEFRRTCTEANATALEDIEVPEDFLF